MHDVIFVGGGVAGCYTASLLPKDLDIMVLEKHKKVRPKDSGIVSGTFSSFFDEKGLVAAKASEIECLSPSGKKFSLRGHDSFISILRREAFTRRLRRDAKKKADLRFEIAEEVVFRKNSVLVVTNRGEHEAKMVVGCDGARSLVRSSMGIEQPRLAAGLMVKTNKNLGEKISVFFNKHYSPDYFSWIIPQSKEYGLITENRPKEYLDYFAAKQGLPAGKLYAYMLPMGTTRSFSNRALLIGDACGQNKPLTGGGIIFSLRASRVAAGMIKDACEAEIFHSMFLGHYERLWKAELFSEIHNQLLARKIYRRLANDEIDKLFEDFGPCLSSLDNFDYDMFSNVWTELPKIKLLKFVLSKSRYLI